MSPIGTLVVDASVSAPRVCIPKKDFVLKYSSVSVVYVHLLQSNETCGLTSKKEMAKMLCNRLFTDTAMLCRIIGVLLLETCPLTQVEVVRISKDYVYFSYETVYLFLFKAYSILCFICPLFQEAKLAWSIVEKSYPKTGMFQLFMTLIKPRRRKKRKAQGEQSLHWI